MRTTIFCGHPTLAESGSHQFLKAATPESVDFVTIDEAFHPDQITADQKLLLETDQFFLQFPIFWYQAPGVISDWLRHVLSDTFLSRYHEQLKGKQFGVIVSIGIPLKHYQAGGREGVSLSELLKPYETIARALGFDYRAPFVLEQHQYQTEQGKYKQLVDFQQHLMLPNNPSFEQRSQWLIQELRNRADRATDETTTQQMLLVAQTWEEELEELVSIEEQLPKQHWR